MHAARMSSGAGGGALRQVPLRLHCTCQQSACARHSIPQPARSIRLDAEERQTQSSIRDSSTSNERLQDSKAATNGAPGKLSPVAVQLEQAHAPSNGSNGTGQHVSEAASSSTAESSTAWYAAVGLSAMAALICSVDRAAISVAILPMSEQFGWSDSIKGAINSSFYIGYTLTNLVGGYLAASWSAKKVLGLGVVVWSIFTITTPPAAAASLPLLFVNRAMMGAGEGVTFPCVQNIVKFWCPADVRTRALVLIYSGGTVGTITALITAPLIIKAFGWPAVFEVYGSLGLFWMVAWQKLVSDTPPSMQQQQQQQLKQQQQQQLSQAADIQQQSGNQQMQQIQQSPQQQLPSATEIPRLQDIPWKTFFTNKAYLGIIMAHMAFGVGHYVCLSWLPTYYNQEFGVDVQQSALLSVLPWFFTVVVNNSAGWAADELANSGRLSMTRTRKLMQTIGVVGPALCLLYLALGHQDTGELRLGEAAALMTGTIAIGGFQSAGFASNHQDISSRYASVLFGITNAASSLMGTFSVFATGLILDATHSWSLVFEGVAVIYLLGGIAFVTLASAEQQFE